MYSLDLLEDGVVLQDAHTEQLLAAIVLVEHFLRVLTQFLHVRPDEHLTKLDEVAVLLIVDLDNTPWIRSPTNDTTILRLNLDVGTNHGERNLRDDGLVLSESLLVLVLVDWGLEDADVVVLNISEDLG